MKKQQGFTLIELIVVIVILGILAAVALPRFVSLEADARVAKANGALAAVKSAADIAHAAQLAQNLGSNSSVTLEGVSITMKNGYPTADANGIGAAARLTADYILTGGNANAGNTLTIATDAAHANCKITYTNPATLGNAPTYSTAPARANCV